MGDIAIFGVGGLGREVLTLVKNINNVAPVWNIVGFFDDGHEKGEMFNGYPNLGNTEDLNHWPTPISVAIAIGNSLVRKQVHSRLNNPMIDYPTLIHPSAWIGDGEYVQIGKGCIICAGVKITTNVRINNFVILNLQCTLGHDSFIKDFVSIMPTVNISGEVTIGECVNVGAAATIINRLEIGEYSIVGAGAVLTKTLPAHCTAVGVPAKIIKFHQVKKVSIGELQ